uniref:ATP synthase F0 subunit 8 n=1 Tax=Atkinsoniella xanthoabdomena TaxID=2930063 RepID=UPI00200083BC|nr:ATP synthase F0 subunit 8 [Atkinsoniella xanthoabdomena]UNZ12668.1 ATP synthase F0 subunit 8 [Atkinsoniella xanthoabdomena]
MPQMAPIWWTLLMMTFLSSFSLMMSLLYFNLMSKSMKMKTNKINQMNWKW